MGTRISRAAISLVALGLLILSAAASADVVILKNGDRLSGTVNSLTGDVLLLATSYAGEIAVPVAEVASVETTTPMRITTAAGDEVVGVLTNDGSAQYLRGNTGLQPLAIGDLAQVVDVDYTTDSWTTNLDFGYVVSSGNSETESGSLHLDSNVVRGNTEHLIHAYWNRDEADGITTRDQFDAGYIFRWYFRDKWYALGNLGYFQDKLKDIDRRITVGAGVGHQFFNTDVSSFSTELGISQVFEDLDGESESNPAIRWGMDYNRWLSPGKIDYFYGHEVLKILDSDRGEIYKINTGIRLHINDNWNANARIDWVHESKPPEGREKTDTTYSVGVGLLF